jgi:aminopeptidase N
MEMPLMVPSNLICNFSYYRIQAYTRPGLAYQFLNDALGDSLFKKALLAYIQRWNGKHPIPFDFFNTFQNVTKEDLMWFFKPWFWGPAYADQAIKGVDKDNKIEIENKGGLPMPVKVVCTYADGTKDNFTESTAVWSKGQKSINIQANKGKVIKKIVLGSSYVPDVYPENNVWKR